jgi:hypothetical protein
VRQAVQHLLVLLPCLGGSALCREDGQVWGTGAALAQAIANPGRLATPKARLDDPEYGDGVETYDPMAILVPRFPGYSGLARGFDPAFVGTSGWTTPTISNSPTADGAR